jgi:hypothetical protein
MREGEVNGKKSAGTPCARVDMVGQGVHPSLFVSFVSKKVGRVVPSPVRVENGGGG